MQYWISDFNGNQYEETAFINILMSYSEVLLPLLYDKVTE